MKFQTGKQCPGDDAADPRGFLARARLHQSRFMANTLELPCDGFGNYLIREDAKKGLNFYDEVDIFEAVRAWMQETFRQVRRNHILGESILQEDGDKYKHFTSLTLFPEGNIHFVKASREYLDFLTKNENNFIQLKYEYFYVILDTQCPDDAYRKWINYLKDRYIVPE